MDDTYVLKIHTEWLIICGFGLTVKIESVLLRMLPRIECLVLFQIHPCTTAQDKEDHLWKD